MNSKIVFVHMRSDCRLIRLQIDAQFEILLKCLEEIRTNPTGRRFQSSFSLRGEIEML